MKANIHLRLELCQPITPALPVGKRRLRHVAVLWAALGQAAACQYFRNCGAETKAQGCVENLICSDGGRALAGSASGPLAHILIGTASISNLAFKLIAAFAVAWLRAGVC
ncbi:MAG: hypothetical protein WBO12_21175 [Xanthobacteraceae bacterium]